jgi:hypothetical protein
MIVANAGYGTMKKNVYGHADCRRDLVYLAHTYLVKVLISRSILNLRTQNPPHSVE